MSASSLECLEYIRRGDIVLYNSCRSDDGSIVYESGNRLVVNDNELLSILGTYGRLFIIGLQGTGKTYLSYYLASTITNNNLDKHVVPIVFRYNPSVETISVKEVYLRIDGREYSKPIIVVETNVSGEYQSIVFNIVLTTLTLRYLEDKKGFIEKLKGVFKRGAPKNISERVVEEASNTVTEVIEAILFYRKRARKLPELFQTLLTNMLGSASTALALQYILGSIYSIPIILDKLSDRRYRSKLEKLLENTVYVIVIDDLKDLSSYGESIEKIVGILNGIESLRRMKRINNLYIIYCYRLSADREEYTRILNLLSTKIESIDKFIEEMKEASIPDNVLNNVIRYNRFVEGNVKKMTIYRLNHLFPLILPSKKLVSTVLEKKHGLKGDVLEKITRASSYTPAIAEIIVKLYKAEVISIEELEQLETIIEKAREEKEVEAEYIDTWKSTLENLYKLIVEKEPLYPILLNTPTGLQEDELGVIMLYNGLVLSKIVHGELDNELSKILKETIGYENLDQILYTEDGEQVSQLIIDFIKKPKCRKYRQFLEHVVENIKNSIESREVGIAGKTYRLPVVREYTEGITLVEDSVYRLYSEYLHYRHALNNILLTSLDRVDSSQASIITAILHTTVLVMSIKALWDYMRKTNWYSTFLLKYCSVVEELWSKLSRYINKKLYYKLILHLTYASTSHPYIMVELLNKIPEPVEHDPETIKIALALAYNILDEVNVGVLPIRIYEMYKERILKPLTSSIDQYKNTPWYKVLDWGLKRVRVFEEIVSGRGVDVGVVEGIVGSVDKSDPVDVLEALYLYTDVIEYLIDDGDYSRAEELLRKARVLLKELKSIKWSCLDEDKKGLLKLYYSPDEPERQLELDRIELDSFLDYLDGQIAFRRQCIGGSGLDGFLKASKKLYSGYLTHRVANWFREAIVGYSRYLRSHVVCNSYWSLRGFKKHVCSLEVKSINGERGLSLVNGFRENMMLSLNEFMRGEKTVLEFSIVSKSVLESVLIETLCNCLSSETVDALDSFISRMYGLLKEGRLRPEDVRGFISGCMLLKLLERLGCGDGNVSLCTTLCNRVLDDRGFMEVVGLQAIESFPEVGFFRDVSLLSLGENVRGVLERLRSVCSVVRGVVVENTGVILLRGFVVLLIV